MAGFGDFVNSSADANGIPRPIFNSLIQQESGFNPYPPNGAAGEIGPGQIMPANIPHGVNAYDPQQNLDLSASILAGNYAKFGNWHDALAAYNAGSGNLAGGSGYADSVLARAGLSSDGISAADTTAGAAALDGNATTKPGVTPTVTVKPSGGASGASASTAPSGAIYAVAIVLIVLLTAFGLYGVVKS